ncbi:BTB/POZ and MATH domain-containing protein [Lachnellula suecica]|uniref:BTB/POZ and MATH domain-containing protein n=1 Tax=Lachnellula suecica TaxID=602035 RepID=A0A8T9CD28_9HELO|nr:BTB/POZ and MATH domain-containing protein [Lachnellula suecica]
MASNQSTTSPWSQNCLVARNTELLESGKYSDFTLRCGNKVFHLHKSVVYWASKYFEAALDGQFTQGNTGHLTIEDAEPEMVARMLDFIYTGAYPDGSDLAKNTTTSEATTTTNTPATTKDSGAPLLHASLYILGDKYEIQSLKDFAVSKYADAVAIEWNTASFVQSIELMYNDTELEGQDRLDLYRDMKDIAVEAAMWNDSVLNKRSDFERIYWHNDDFHDDVIRRAKKLAEPPRPNEVPVCPKCGSSDEIMYIRFGTPGWGPGGPGRDLYYLDGHDEDWRPPEEESI